MMELGARENRPSFKRKRDNYAKKLREKKLINYLRSELRTCTTHGLPYIVNTDIHWFERLFWVMSFLVSVAIVIALLWMQYFRYATTPIVTSVEMDYFNWNVSFPAITLCPTYKMNDIKTYQLTNNTLDRTGIDIDTQVRLIALISYDNADVVDLEVKPTNIVLAKDYSKLTATLFRSFDYNSLTTSTNWPISVSQSMTEMGMCHVINSNVAEFDDPISWYAKHTTAKYSKNNIDITVYERDFFVQVINYADIYKVFIHGPNEPIQSTSPSYSSKSSNYIEFGVRVWSTRISDILRTAPIDVRNCRFLDEPISARYPVYTYSHCLIECKIKMILKLCDCIPHIYKPLPHERICDIPDLQCWVDHIKEISSLTVSNETLINATSTTDLPRSPRDCGCVNNCDTDMFMKDHETFVPQDNYNSVRLGISSYPKVRIIKDTIVNLYDIILRSGGVINLCLGTSVISLMELMVLFAKMNMVYTAKMLSIIITLCLGPIHRIKNLRIKKQKKNKKQF